MMEELIRQGETLFQEGKVDEAECCFLNLLEHYPNHADVLNNIGVINHIRGNIEKAEEYFLHAHASENNYVDAILNLADLYHEQERWKEEANQLEKYTSIADNDCHGFNRLGFAYLKTGDIILAQAALERSLEINSEQGEVKDTLKILKGQHSGSSAPRTSPTPVISLKSQPVVSVGLPVYNGGKTLRQAIETVLAQEFQNIELIISDNCSTDETMEICLQYQNTDKRIRYYRFSENVGSLKNFKNALGLANAPYFMWTSHDDLRESAMISKCLERIETDPSIALVYPRAKVLDADSKFLGIANDHLNTDQDYPVERFRHLIWEITMCNMFYGLYRTDIAKRACTWGKSLFWDNLFLAEIALMGKIVQIDDVLFVRRLTRNYDYRTLDDRYVQLISTIDSNWFKDGITLPHCRLAYAHLELLNYSELNDAEKNFLMHDTVKCFRTRFGAKMEYEINRTIELINTNNFYYTWNNMKRHTDVSEGMNTIDYFHSSNLLSNLQEALFIYPERTDLMKAYETCLERVSHFKIE